ncbi:aminotransferase class I/II-fold pyridoxal phosphate-dependent enzyme [Leucobacter soli]|uniref:Arginine decarboxylase n=2 Tax=Leucobacter soli TaxID=2812850 RepID=A0A916JXV5_9MICO|nr:amino acid decarboxylase [Leucobacter soli]CAG7612390.1 Arginine decarboxylase [Leucobacter soli]
MLHVERTENDQDAFAPGPRVAGLRGHAIRSGVRSSDSETDAQCPQSDAQCRTPYLDAVAGLADSHPLQIMVPGHGGTADHGGHHLADVYGERMVQLDVPLMLEGVDLGDDSPLNESLALAAEAWGARRTWWLTNGASQGNRTAAFAVRGLGERVLMQRSSHSSFTDGVLLAGLIPAFVNPNVDQQHGIAHGLTPEMLEEALRAEAEAGRAVQSVYVVSPSYFGSTADVAGLSRVAHAYDAALIVDGAWGAHFGFHPDLPESPARLGGDLVISSTHKLAGSLTQSAMLHLGEGPFAERLEPLVKRAYTMTASTSASSILMGSLDAARHALVHGGEQISESVKISEEFRERLRADSRFSVISDGFDAFPDIVATDPLRVPIDVSALGQSGHWVRDRLIADHNVYFEMSTGTSIVAVIGALATPDLERIMDALTAVADQADALRAAGGVADQNGFPPLPAAGVLRMIPRSAFFGESEIVPASEAVGRVSSDTLAAYPPGIPNLVPGEEITEETVSFLQAVAGSPTGYVRGAVDPRVAQFRVVRDPVTASQQG